ncbi:MAG: two-component system sensor kinase [Actinomycetia bacterium]|nr:two-component system sensor kinase [Actinomycetes bacterium]
MTRIGTVLRAPFTVRTWRELLHVLLGGVLGLLALAYLIALAVALVLGLTVVGTVLLAGLFAGTWLFALAESGRARVLLGMEVPRPDPYRAPQPGFTGWVRGALKDRESWRRVAYLQLAALAGVLQAYVTALVWAEALGMVSYPLWYRLLPVANGHHGDPLGGFYPDTIPLPIAAAGLVLLVVAAWVTRGFAQLDRLRIRALLNPPRLRERVEVLERQRRQAAVQSTSQLRRLERDLHDGAQVRLVALALELGRARDDLDSGSDLAGAAARVAAAHEESKLVLAELRELARGIYPAVLTDLGLDGAVPLLTARCPVPAEAEVDLPSRPPGPVESTAYFCVSELLANVAKHSGAARAAVRITASGGILRVSVDDDGRGGAAAGALGGLAGLADRAASAGGTLTVDSPAGGPTRILVELPCES